MATLTPQTGGSSGVTLSFVAADVAGDEFPNNGRTVLIVKNDDTGSHDVTIVSQENCSQGFNHDVVVSVAAGEQALIGQFSRSRFNDTNGLVQVTYDDVTSVTVAVVNT